MKSPKKQPPGSLEPVLEDSTKQDWQSRTTSIVKEAGDSNVEKNQEVDYAEVQETDCFQSGEDYLAVCVCL